MLAVVATFSTIIKIQVLTVTPASYSGYDRHSVALVVLGVFALLMVAGGVRGARPAMAAVALIGLAVLLIAVLVDLPHLDDTGVWPLADQYEDAQAAAGKGYYFETAAGILMLVGGVGMLLLAPRGGRTPRPERAADRAGAAPPSPPTPRPAAESAAPASEPVPAPRPAPPESWFEPGSGPAADPPDPASYGDEYAPRPRPPARRRQGGIVGRLRGKGR